MLGKNFTAQTVLMTRGKEEEKLWEQSAKN